MTGRRSRLRRIIHKRRPAAAKRKGVSDTPARHFWRHMSRRRLADARDVMETAPRYTRPALHAEPAGAAAAARPSHQAPGVAAPAADRVKGAPSLAVANLERALSGPPVFAGEPPAPLLPKTRHKEGLRRLMRAAAGEDVVASPQRDLSCTQGPRGPCKNTAPPRSEETAAWAAGAAITAGHLPAASTRSTRVCSCDPSPAPTNFKT
ncbi:uncharacterized protein LOC126484819 [Schistocerca serialis cubense]|uniref:uncharacterized protein LOC126484819 n=1 Tax=Schistocerca serialis cubense TaxID=2023355 RepID=UPI00214EC657|nr:uncharacterized protein LOC126484819 [Schistocerca serialis cubense]